jgi:hypothetical protein
MIRFPPQIKYLSFVSVAVPAFSTKECSMSAKKTNAVANGRSTWAVVQPAEMDDPEK